jgi:hypothetical protein
LRCCEPIAKLKLSIEQDGFWGGVVCRQLPDGTVQVAAGHHRVAAALAAGITEADLFVAEEMDDASMIRVYARENATQRGVSSTALAGTVAAALKYVAKCILRGTGGAEKFLRTFHVPTVRDRLLSDDGMGWRVLLAFLDDIPGINVGAIQHQLANLKYSGDYARLIAEVQQEIAAEQAAAEASIDLQDGVFTRGTLRHSGQSFPCEGHQPAQQSRATAPGSRRVAHQ